MLGVVNQFLALRFQIADRIVDDLQVLFKRDTQGASDVEIPGLSEDGNGRGSGVRQLLRIGVGLHRVAREVG